VTGQFRAGLQSLGQDSRVQGESSEVQGRPQRFWVGLEVHASAGVVRSTTSHVSQVPLAKQFGGLDTKRCFKKH
jgi:hypothetical protein